MCQGAGEDKVDKGVGKHLVGHSIENSTGYSFECSITYFVKYLLENTVHELPSRRRARVRVQSRMWARARMIVQAVAQAHVRAMAWIST